MFAKRAPMVVFDLFKPEDYKAMFAKHAWTDRSEVDIDQYLTAQERIELCDYEKDRMRNIKKNYDVMVDMGLPAEKPYFMQKNRPKFLQPVDDSSESDGEWVPSKNRPRAKKPVNAGWKPPVKKRAAVTSSVKLSKAKPTKPKSKRRGKAVKSAAIKPRAVSEEVVFSDSEDEDFEGFSAADVEQSEARAADILPRNEAILADIEAGTYDFDLSDDEQEESESSDSQQADVASESVTETPAEKPDAEPPAEGRYPRRSIARKVYTEPEVPKDDHYLYCEECDHDYEGDCPVHGPLLIIHDTQVANDGSDPDRADHSLPKGLVVRKSQIPLAGDGVWCEKRVPKGARFGPYEGIKEDDGDEAHKSGYCWVIYADGKAISHYVDAGDKSQANWLRYVNCARNEGEQNLLAYQFHGEVYYRTVQEILPGQELLVWYGDEYGRELGLLGEEEGKEQQGQPAQLGQDALRKLFHDAGFELWACNVCGRVFPSEEWRDGHRRGHGDRSGSKKYVCTQCNYSTDNGSHYNKHLVTHSGDRPHKCQLCGKAFTTSGDLSSHQRVHTGDKPYKCPVCGKRFNDAGNQKKHSRTHTGEKPYSCPLCARGFSLAHHLTTHMRTHTGERPYSCVTCGYRCSDSSNLVKHMRTHTGEKPYVCATCGQGFSQSNHLKHHTYTHTGQWPYSCSPCKKGFAIQSELRKHKQRNHSL